MPQYSGCQLGHCGQTPVLPESPVWLSCAQSRSCRFSPSLVPYEAVNGRLRASLTQGCCFNLGREGGSSQARGERRGCPWYLCSGVMENFAGHHLWDQPTGMCPHQTLH